jgi:predicted peptidase
MTAVRLLILTGTVVLALKPLPARAADPAHGFLSRSHKDPDGREAKYVLFVPLSYKGDEPYPVILFLHGAGERAGGQKQPVEVGIGPAIKKHEKDFPFLVIFPQAQKTWRAGSEDANRALAILTEVQKEYKADPKRTYLAGLSMGGSGTWSLAAQDPQRWAAIVPICGRGDPKTAAAIKAIPCWGFQGDADRAALVGATRQMMNALWAAGGHPNYTEYPGVGHNSWDQAYGTHYLYEWLLKHKRK